jgi:hypothetical protein
VQVTNQSGLTLGSHNDATVWAIVYEQTEPMVAGRRTARFVRAVARRPVTTPLSPGATQGFSLDTKDLGAVNWVNLKAVALVDYRPGGNSGPYDSLQAVAVPIH